MLRLCTPPPKSPKPPEKEFLVGVNYWPRTPGASLGCAFDVDAVHEDFAALSELGIKHARVYLHWSDFQSCPSSRSCVALAHLLSLCDAAAAEELKVELCLFSSHSAPNLRTPRWLVPEEQEKGTSPYFFPGARTAARALVNGVTQLLATHPAVQGYNLGGLPERLGPTDSFETARDWFVELSQELREREPRRPVAWELEGSDLSRTDGLRIDRLSSTLDYSVVSRPSLDLQPTPKPTIKPALFACALAAALTEKPAVLQAWAPDETLQVDARQVANHAEALLSGLRSQGAQGAYLWWFSDSDSPPDTPAHSKRYGLFDGDGQLRPHGNVLRNFAATRPQVVPAPTNGKRLTVEPDEFYRAPKEQLRRLYAQFEQA